MTAACETAARRRALVTWTAGLLRFAIVRGDRRAQHEWLELLDALDAASDDDLADWTPRIAEVLRVGTMLVPWEGQTC